MGKNIILVFAKLKSPFSTHNYMCFLKISLEVFGVQMMPTMASRDLLCARILCFVFIVQVHVPVSSCDVMSRSGTRTCTGIFLRCHGHRCFLFIFLPALCMHTPSRMTQVELPIQSAKKIPVQKARRKVRGFFAIREVPSVLRSPSFPPPWSHSSSNSNTTR